MSFLTQAKLVLDIYWDCFSRALVISKRYWWVLISIYVYFFIFLFGGFVLSRLGIVGGLIFGLIIDACISSFLVMVETMVRQQRISVEDFKKSFWVYFWDVMGVLFFYYIVSLLVLGPLAHAGHLWLVLAIKFALFVLFNPMPELIYKERFGTTELYQRAYQFIIVNWPEWFIPNILVAGILIFIYRLPLPSSINFMFKGVFFAFAIYFFMIFRGLLFDALYGSSRRMRRFQQLATRGN